MYFTVLLHGLVHCDQVWILHNVLYCSPSRTGSLWSGLILHNVLYCSPSRTEIKTRSMTFDDTGRENEIFETLCRNNTSKGAATFMKCLYSRTYLQINTVVSNYVPRNNIVCQEKHISFTCAWDVEVLLMTQVLYLSRRDKVVRLRHQKSRLKRRDHISAWSCL